MVNLRRIAARALEKAEFEISIRQMSSLARESDELNQVVVMNIAGTTILQYPQSYLSKLWNGGYKTEVLKTIHRVQEHHLSMKQAYILFKLEAKQRTNINISFNRDTVSERHCSELGYLLWRLGQDY
jgi:hypothetical protein